MHSHFSVTSIFHGSHSSKTHNQNAFSMWFAMQCLPADWCVLFLGHTIDLTFNFIRKKNATESQRRQIAWHSLVLIFWCFHLSASSVLNFYALCHVDTNAHCTHTHTRIYVHHLWPRKVHFAAAYITHLTVFICKCKRRKKKLKRKNT